MSDGWHYGDGDSTVGPVSFEQIVEFLRGRPDWMDVQVWHADFDGWRVAGDVHQLAFALKRQPPAQPASPPVQASGPRPARSRDRRRWALGAIGLALLVAAVVAGAYLLPHFMQPAIIREEFARIVASTRPTLPRQLADGLTLIDVTAAERRLTYRHAVDIAKFTVPNNFAARMKAQILPQACTAAIREVLEAGGALEYLYRTRNSIFVGSFVIEGADCDRRQGPER